MFNAVIMLPSNPSKSTIIEAKYQLVTIEAKKTKIKNTVKSLHAYTSLMH